MTGLGRIPLSVYLRMARTGLRGAAHYARKCADHLAAAACERALSELVALEHAAPPVGPGHDGCPSDEPADLAESEGE